MEKKLAKILYILIAISFILIADYLVVDSLYTSDSDFHLLKRAQVTTIDYKLLAASGNYSKYTLDYENPKNHTQEWFSLALRDDCEIKFQYYNKNSEISYFNIRVNDIELPNDIEFKEEEKFKLNFYLFNNTLVLEHERVSTAIPLVKIIDLNTGSISNILNDRDFYINDINISSLGVSVYYSRNPSPLTYYMENSELQLPLSVDGENYIVDICNQTSWARELYLLDYVALDTTYVFDGTTIDFLDPKIDKVYNFQEYIKEFTQNLKDKCP